MKNSNRLISRENLARYLRLYLQLDTDPACRDESHPVIEEEIDKVVSDWRRSFACDADRLTFIHSLRMLCMLYKLFFKILPNVSKFAGKFADVPRVREARRLQKLLGGGFLRGDLVVPKVLVDLEYSISWEKFKAAWMRWSERDAQSNLAVELNALFLFYALEDGRHSVRDLVAATFELDERNQRCDSINWIPQKISRHESSARDIIAFGDFDNPWKLSLDPPRSIAGCLFFRKVPWVCHTDLDILPFHLNRAIVATIGRD